MPPRPSTVALPLLASAVLLLGAAAPAPADPVLGIADDNVLLGTPRARERLLDTAQSHGAAVVRTVLHYGTPPRSTLDLAASARGRGLPLQVVLALPPAAGQDGLTPVEFAAWAGTVARGLAATGADLRLAVLNEPDLLITASDRCDDDAEIRTVLESRGLRIEQRQVRVRLPGTRLLWRMVRRGREGWILRRKRVPEWRWVAERVEIPVQGSGEVITTSPRQGCLSITRARRAAAFLAAAVPAVRAGAPGAEIAAGETSPQPPLEVFLDELARVGVPPVDAWTHHPYPLIENDVPVSSHDGGFGSDRIGAWAATMRRLFGAGTLDVTEFGVLRGWIDDDAAVGYWRDAWASACSAGIRSFVAYQWLPEHDHYWDSSVLDENGRDRPVGALLPSLAC